MNPGFDNFLNPKIRKLSIKNNDTPQKRPRIIDLDA